jgi:hypothetical protein
VVVSPGNTVEARNIGFPRGGQTARRHDAKSRTDGLATIGPDEPFADGLIVMRGDHAGLERDAVAQAKSLGDMPRVGEDCRLLFSVAIPS